MSTPSSEQAVTAILIRVPPRLSEWYKSVLTPGWTTGTAARDIISPTTISSDSAIPISAAQAATTTVTSVSCRLQVRNIINPTNTVRPSVTRPRSRAQATTAWCSTTIILRWSWLPVNVRPCTVTPSPRAATPL